MSLPTTTTTGSPSKTTQTTTSSDNLNVSTNTCDSFDLTSGLRTEVLQEQVENIVVDVNPSAGDNMDNIRSVSGAGAGESEENPNVEESQPKYPGSRQAPLELDTLGLFAGLASDLSGSGTGTPIKKVQFEVGEDGEELSEDRSPDERMPPVSLQLPLQLNLNYSTSEPITINSPTRTGRGEFRDYSTSTTASLSLLPSTLPVISEDGGVQDLQDPSTLFHSPTNTRNPIKAIESLKNFISSNNNYNNYYDPQERSQENLGFVQLDVLTGDGDADIGSKEWKEISRWIKYEEDLLEQADRWGKPNVANLTFHSLVNLRQLIEHDALMMLDLDERDMPGIAYRVVEECASKGVIDSDICPLLMRMLLLKHKHVQESERSWFNLRNKNTSSAVSLQSLFDEKNRSRSGVFPTQEPLSNIVRRNSAMNKEFSSPTKSLQRTASGNYLKQNGEFINVLELKPIEYGAPSDDDLKWTQKKDHVIRLLPPGAESTLIMIGDFEYLKKPVFVFVRLTESALMYNVLEVPVPMKFCAFLLLPNSVEVEHIEIGRSFGTLMSNRNFFEICQNGNGRKCLLSGINYFLDETIVLPPSDWNDNHDLLSIHALQAKSKSIKLRRIKREQQSSFLFNSSRDSFSCEGQTSQHHHHALQRMDSNKSQGQGGYNEKKEEVPENPFHRTGKPFGGLINDIRRRYAFYKSDITDSFNMQCISTIIFMYFASIAHTISFAGLTGEKTNNQIGMSETLLSTSLSGIFFSIFSGQPLIPIGPTGPLLVYDEILFAFCGRHNIEFLSARIWISIWLMVFTIFVVCFEGSVLVKWFSRFTQDIFAVLTSILLIFESVDNLVEIYEHHPLSYTSHGKVLPLSLLNTNMTKEEVANYTAPQNNMVIDETEEYKNFPNTALLSTMLMLGTFFLAYFLREFRNSVFLGERTRRALGDFGVPISIAVMVFLDYSATDTYTQKMRVPEGLAPSDPDIRGWLIHPMGNQTPIQLWVIFGTIVPAMLLFILLFMTTQICELIVNTKERKLKKGSGFHLDLLLIAIINLANAFFGAPWLCCATLRGLAHVTALTVYSQNNPPGEKPSIVEVKEQRVSSFLVATLIGCSVIMAPFLKFIPLAVLFGIFLYLGVSSLSSTQLFDRFRLLFIPAVDHPQVPYVRKVRTWKMHLFTLIQILSLILLWAVKSTKECALLFPLFLIFMIPVRFQLKHIFSESELEALDGDPSKKK